MSSQPQFSICIPNFNYESYLPITLDSVQAQQFSDFEVVIADNASTDDSVVVIQRYQSEDPRIQLRENKINVGFAGNLEKTASMANGDWMTMLSSDDLIDPSFLMLFDKFINELGESSSSTIFSTTQTVIDGDGKAYDEIGVDWKLWKGAVLDQKLSELAGADVYRIDGKTLLRQSLQLMRTPFAFASMTYPRSLYEAAEGYSQTSIINPDKKFAWAILAHASEAIVVDKPLVRYRVHNRNQGSQQASSGALKHLTDQYIATFSLDSGMLASLGLQREDLEKAFVEEDIALRSLLAVSRGDRAYARRALRFGSACYPQHTRSNLKCWALRTALAMGPLGTLAMKYVKKTQMPRWQSKSAQRPEGIHRQNTAPSAPVAV